MEAVRQVLTIKGDVVASSDVPRDAKVVESIVRRGFQDNRWDIRPGSLEAQNEAGDQRTSDQKP